MNIPSNDPLLSCIAALYTLILLYFPCTLRTFLSPVLVLATLLILILLRLGFSHKLQLQPPPNIIDNNNPRTSDEEEEQKEVKVSAKINEKGQSQASASSCQVVDQWVVRCREGQRPDHGFGSSFVGWDVGAPLEVIYEAHQEGGEADEEDADPGRVGFPDLERYPSLCMYYPETDSDSSSEDGDSTVAGGCESPERVCFRWEEEDREGSLIEIALNGREKKNSGPGLDFHIEEENLIEIDISPHKNDAVGL